MWTVPQRRGRAKTSSIAYDKATGNVVHEMTLPAFTCGNPMTYMIGGKQYIAVAIGAPNFAPELIALSLP